MLLEVLGFKGGEILGIKDDFERYNTDRIQIKIEHPDMPTVIPGDTLMEIAPIYERFNPIYIRKSL